MNLRIFEDSADHTEARAGLKLAILLVGAVEDSGAEGRSIFNQFRCHTDHAKNCGEALPLIGRDVHGVIVSERDLPDGNWKDVLEAAAARQNPPVLIVTSRLADEYLWAEVLNLGGYDVLAKPFDRDEVRRTVSLAWQHWQNQHEITAAVGRNKPGNGQERNQRENREARRAYQGSGNS